MKKSLLLLVSLASAYTISIDGSAAAQLQAPDEQPKHHHYKLIDIGTFGGPGGGIEGPASPALNARGMLVGASDTAAQDPFAPNFCFLSCNVDLGFWEHDGIVTPLPPPPSGAGLSSIAYAINNWEQIVGQAQNGAIDAATGWPVTHGVLWQRGHVIDLGALGGTQSIANSINDWGQVVGAALTAMPDPYANSFLVSGCESPNAYQIFPPTFSVCSMFFPGTTATHAFVWQYGRMHDLGTLGGPDSTAFINNNLGEVAGWSFTGFVANPSTGVPTMDPFYWSPLDGKMIDLGGLGGTAGAVVWINNRGQIAGVSNTAGDTTAHPFLWGKATGMRDLGTLGGTFGHPDWMNEEGDVVGFSTIANNVTGHGFLWHNGVMTDLGTLGTDPFSEAGSINSKGQIVGGTFILGVADLRGFLWENGGPMVDINTLLVPGTSMYVVGAGPINDRGEIGCFGSDPGETSHHACLLIPCDEAHPNIAGCDYSLVEAGVAENASAAPAPEATAAGAAALEKTLSNLTPAERVAHIRRMMARNRRFALQPAQ